MIGKEKMAHEKYYYVCHQHQNGEQFVCVYVYENELEAAKKRNQINKSFTVRRHKSQESNTKKKTKHILDTIK